MKKNVIEMSRQHFEEGMKQFEAVGEGWEEHDDPEPMHTDTIEDPVTEDTPTDFSSYGFVNMHSIFDSTAMTLAEAAEKGSEVAAINDAISDSMQAESDFSSEVSGYGDLDDGDDGDFDGEGDEDGEGESE